MQDKTLAETLTPASAGPVAHDFKVTKLPIDRQSIKSRRLLDMIEMVEVLAAPGERTVWQMLVDAGADADHLDREAIPKCMPMSNFGSSIFNLVNEGARRSENFVHGLIRD